MPEALLKAVNLNESRSGDHAKTHAVLAPLPTENGYLFGLLDLRGVDGNTDAFLNLFVEQVEQVASTMTAETHLQHRFEELVATLNERIGSASWDFQAKELNALLGLAGDDRLYLTGVGDVTALFLHRGEQERWKVFNLFRGIQTEHHIPEWSKLFTVVLDGDLAPGDVFLVGNKEIPQQIDSEDLHQILVTLPPKSASEKIRQYFPAPTDLSALVLRAESATSPEAMELSDAGASLDYFRRTKETTSRMLEHQRPRKEDWVRGVKRGSRFSIALLHSSLNVALALLMGILKDAFGGAKRLSQSGTRGVWQGRRSFRMPAVPLKNRRFLSIAGGVLIVLVAFIGFSVIRKNQERANAAYRTLVSDIEKTYDTASASIIYKDEDQARELLLEGLAGIRQLPQKSSEQKNRMSELEKQFTERLNELRHTVDVGELTLLASLPEGQSAATLAFDTTTAFAFTNSGAVLRYDASTSSFSPLSVTAPENLGAPVRVRYDDLNNAFYVFDGRQVARLDPTDGTYTLTPVSEISSDVRDVEYYARRIYALSPENEQVYRHERSGDGFGAGVGWIEARTIPLRDATSFSIDGSLWVLKADGRIVRYQKGLEESWPSPTIDPPLPASSVLWTTDRTTSLYLLDREGSRIIEIEKGTANLKRQFTHPAFTDMSGMWEFGDALYVLTPAGLHTFKLE